MTTIYDTTIINSIDVTNTTSDLITTTTESVNLCPNLKKNYDPTTQKYITEIKCNKVQLPTTFDDIVVDLSKIGSNASAPSFDLVSGSSILRANNLLQDKEIFFTAQIPHKWLIGSTIQPHLHCIPVMNQIGASTISMQLNISILNYKSKLVNNDAPDIIKTNIYNSYTSSYSGQQVIIPFQSITNVTNELLNKNISSILLCKLKTTGTELISALYVLSFDFHYQAKYLGSTEEYTQ